jgi:transposase
MEKVSIIGLDLAKRGLQAHGARADGGVAFRKKLSRDKVLAFLAEQPRCVVAMEACGAPITGDAPSALSAMKFD